MYSLQAICQSISGELTTSLLVILDDAMPKLTMYSTMFFWNTSVGDFTQIVTARPRRKPIGPSGDNTLVPCAQQSSITKPSMNIVFHIHPSRNYLSSSILSTPLVGHHVQRTVCTKSHCGNPQKFSLGIIHRTWPKPRWWLKSSLLMTSGYVTHSHTLCFSQRPIYMT